MTDTTEQQAVPVAQESAARKLLIDFMTSPSYDPHAKRHGDTVEAAIEFTLARLAALTPDATQTREAELLEALQQAREALEVYADPTGYADNQGDQYTSEDTTHPGCLAQATLDRLATVAAANDEGVARAIEAAANICLEVSGLIGAANGSSIDSALLEAARRIRLLSQGEKA